MILPLLILVIVTALGRTSGTAVIHNDRRMLDSTGAQMDAHMQDIHRWDPSGPWYLYAMQFGTCYDKYCCDEACGCRTDVNLTVHTSPDLSDGSWVLRSAVAVAPSQRPANATFCRPKVIYNAATKRYVLWLNWFPMINGSAKFMSSGYQTLVSTSPDGPFVSAVVSVPTLHAAGGDMGIFLDSDGAGYLIYTSIAVGHRISVERLSEDFTNTTRHNSGLLPFPGGCFESPAMFARGNTIFALAAPCCCNGKEGSTVAALRSTGGPFGPFVSAGATAAAVAGSVTPTPLTPLSSPPPAPPCPHCVVSNLNHSQQGSVVPVPSSGNVGEIQYLWMGDRWKSAPDHRKGHDLTVFTLLNFSNDGLSIGVLQWSPTVELS